MHHVRRPAVPRPSNRQPPQGSRVALAVLLAALTASAPAAATAQSTDWTIQLLVPPFGSSFVSEWERNPQNLTLALTYLGTTPVDYRIEGVLVGAGRGELAVAVSPPLTIDGGPVTEFFTGDDLLDWEVRARRDVVDRAFQTGVVPEDDYEICVRIVATTGIQLADSCAVFQVRLPETPELLLPLDGADVPDFQPVFQWTPVFVPEELGIDYRMTVVERYPSQTPATAIRANLPLFDELVGEAPLLVYPVDALELEPGREYVWQVEVMDGFGEPLVPGGLISPPRTFRVTGWGGAAVDGAGGLPDRIALSGDWLHLTDLEGVEVERIPAGWLLDGQARVELAGPYGRTGRARVEGLLLDDFEGSLSAVEGRVVIRLDEPLAVPDEAGSVVRELVFSPDGGVRAYRLLRDGRAVEPEQELRLTPDGLRRGGS